MRSNFKKTIAIFILLNLLAEIFWPSVAWALTGGPSQPEVQSFEPSGTTEMVDLFSGDFVYNIPLIDVGGYPINMSYHSGIGMDQEASWVGLGWNINPGVINRNMRGLPDDFNGDAVTKQMKMEPNATYGVGGGLGLELIGLKNNLLGLNLDVGMGIFFNNYKGWGYNFSIDPAISAGSPNKLTGTLGLGIDFNSQEGIGVNPNLSFAATVSSTSGESANLGLGIGAPYNSRTGLKALTLNTSLNVSTETTTPDGEKSSTSTNVSNGGSKISFGTPTYVPQIGQQAHNLNLSFRVTVGTELFGMNGHYYVNGYYSGQMLDEEPENLPAYGYLFTENGTGAKRSLHDFNREKDGSYTRKKTNLPLTNYTYDVYSVQAEGLGATYRPYRGDLGVIPESYAQNTSSSDALGYEIGSTQLVKVGANLGVNTSESYSDKWKEENDIAANLQFKGKDDVASTEYLYEPFYFKNAGEKAAVDLESYKKVGQDHAVMVKLDASGRAVNLYDKETNNDKLLDTIKKYTNYRRKREKRNQPFYFLNAEDASHFGLNNKIVSYQPNTLYVEGELPIDTIISRVNDYAKGHHASEVTVLKPDGSRYIFGIPAYNKKQEETSFNVSGIGRTVNSSTGIVTYEPGDNSVSNENGLDHYYNSTQLPGYAHSYMLSAVLSADYIDITGDGITDDDYGTATKFNYTLADRNYKWRVPYGAYSSNYNEGYKFDKTDDKASYVYGEKELWYLHSIETKHYIAEFKTSSRQDAYEVSGRDGGIGQGSMKKLDKIVLYSKQDRVQYGENAKPIKTIHFEYDYSLCPGVENNKGNAVDIFGNATTDTSPLNVNKNKGKLTLRRVYFTYEDSQKGKLGSYKFTYNEDVNPSYNLKGYDRWGNYKPNASGTLSDPNTPLSNADCPYVLQNKDSANKYASAWSLTQIDLPSGGTIKLKYESDDYAFVQDRRAMQMFNIIGASDTLVNPTMSGQLFSGNNENRYLFFKLQDSLYTSNYTKTQAEQYIREQYLDNNNIRRLYFKFLVRLKGSGYEYVPGYAEIENSGVLDISGGSPAYTIGYIQVKPKHATNSAHTWSKNVNPISYAAWHFLKLNTPGLLYNQKPNTDLSPVDVVTSIVNFATDIKRMFKGYSQMCRDAQYGKDFVLNKSFIRLYNPNKKKLGGGVRVAKISVSDNWDKMASGSPAASEYGQTYDYTTEERLPNGLSRKISTGVASYEPIIGGEENPWRQPVESKDADMLIPDNEHYQEEPFGESFFPSPSVGYSSVKVANLPHPGVQRTATGYTINEFYTAKDFPVFVKQTEIIPVQQKSSFLSDLFTSNAEDYLAVSQGYAIELNDMHGKPKAKKVYAENKPDYPISSIEFIYQKDAVNPKKLNNDVTIIDKSGVISTGIVGIDYDFVTDMREQRTDNAGSNTGFNLDGFSLGFIPFIPLISLWPGMSTESTRFRSAVVTKVINRYGILKETVAYDNTSKVTTQNLALDGETGEVLLTSVQNEWDDPVYNFNYPAHWAYDGMGQAYQNIGAKFKNLSIVNGTLNNLINPEAYFVPGDEIKVTKNASNKYHVAYKTTNGIYADKIWVQKINGKLVFIDRWGNRVNFIANNINAGNAGEDTYIFEIIRSGRRNQHNTPIGAISTLKNPIQNGSITPVLNSEILTTSAAEFSEDWQTFCNKIPTMVCDPVTQEARDLNTLLTRLAKFNHLCIPNDVATSCSSAEPHLFDTSNNNFVIDPLFNFFGNSKLRPYLNTEIEKTTNDSCDASAGYYGYFFTRFKYFKTLNVEDRSVLHALIRFQPGAGAPNVCFGDRAGCELYISSNDPNFEFNDVDSFSNIRPAKAVLGPNYNFYITAHFTDTSKAPVDLLGISCVKITDCRMECLTANPSDTLNPYQVGLKGNWRAKQSHVYLQKRKSVNTTQQTNIRKDGVFSSYNPFWVQSNGKWLPNATDPQWVWNSQVTKYSPFGQEIENKDPLNRYSAALHDFHQSVPSAISNNAKYRQSAFDAFEDYEQHFFSPDLICPPREHFRFPAAEINNRIDSTESHTGLMSMYITPNDSESLYKFLGDCGFSTQQDTLVYKLTNCNCIEEFNPDTGHKYVITAWAKQKMSGGQKALNYSQPEIKVALQIGATYKVLSFKPSGTIIEDWQRIYGTFIIPQGTVSMRVWLMGGTSGVNYDDLRIHPFNSNMKSYVYNARDLKVMAELDENNYSTIYEYDEEGALIRVKKETEKGIMTIKESRNSKTKVQNP